MNEKGLANSAFLIFLLLIILVVIIVILLPGAQANVQGASHLCQSATEASDAISEICSALGGGL